MEVPVQCRDCAREEVPYWLSSTVQSRPPFEDTLGEGSKVTSSNVALALALEFAGLGEGSECLGDDDRSKATIHDVVVVR